MAMKKMLGFSAVFIFAAAALAGTSFGKGLAIGDKLDDFSLRDASGVVQTFNGLKGTHGAVVIFLSAECPVVRGYVQRINQLAADYQSKGIAFIGVNANVTETAERVKANAGEYGFKFPVLIDKGNAIADRFGANVTPEAFYFDASNVLLFHGAIDNDRGGRNVTQSYLRTAFDSGLAGKPIEKATANAFGCSIRRVGDQ
jgi:peroxiredoxin